MVKIFIATELVALQRLCGLMAQRQVHAHTYVVVGEVSCWLYLAAAVGIAFTTLAAPLRTCSCTEDWRRGENRAYYFVPFPSREPKAICTSCTTSNQLQKVFIKICQKGDETFFLENSSNISPTKRSISYLHVQPFY